MRCLILALSLVACSTTDDFPDDPDTGEDTDPEPWHCVDTTWAAENTGNGQWRVTTDHYRLTWEGSADDAEDAARILEMAWLGMRDYWQGRTPVDDPLLSIGVYANEASWAAALTDDGIAVPNGAGGYYWPANQTAYLYQQPTQYYTQTLLIHEAAHQFHDLATNGLSDLPSWYNEGIAESLGRHDWDGECGRLSRRPTISRTDIGRDALNQINRADLNALVASSGAQSRPLSYALVRYLEQSEHAEAWLRVREATDAGTFDVNEAFQNEIGTPDALTDALTTWLDTVQQPLQPTYIEWLHRRPERIIGWADNAITIAPATSSMGASATVSFDAYWTQGYAGVVTGYRSSDDWSALLVDRAGQLSAFAVSNGTVDWQSFSEAVDLSMSDDPVRIDWDGSALRINDTVFDALGHTPTGDPMGGLALYGGEVLFDDLTLSSPK